MLYLYKIEVTEFANPHNHTSVHFNKLSIKEGFSFNSGVSKMVFYIQQLNTENNHKNKTENYREKTSIIFISCHFHDFAASLSNPKPETTETHPPPT